MQLAASEMHRSGQDLVLQLEDVLPRRVGSARLELAKGERRKEGLSVLLKWGEAKRGRGLFFSCSAAISCFSFRAFSCGKPRGRSPL